MRPKRRSLRPLLAVALAGVAAVACAGCLGAASAAPQVPHCARPAAGARTPPASSASTVAVAYLSALGDHRYDGAQRYAHACSAGQQHSLDQLWLWLASMPTQQVRVTGAEVTPVANGVTVRATVFAKFGPAPYSAWVTLGPKTLRLAHVDLGKVRTPAGFQYSSFTYIDLSAWRALPNIEQASMVVHELTHVVTRPMLAGAPHSLLEGIAMYEEDAYLGQSSQTMLLDEIDAYYMRNAFPTLQVWRRRESDWGLPNVRAISLSYLDALAMTHAIMTENGGVPALRRLGAAFRAEHARRDFTAAQVQQAFRTGLGVSFGHVVAEAHAFASRVVAAGG